MNQITGHTRFGGLLGSPVSHSISPAMHNMAFRERGIDWVYLAFDVTPDRLGETLKVFRELNVFGFNVTMPDKQSVMEYLDEVSAAARMIGAVNTIVNRDGRLTGHNTDGYGFSESVREKGFELAGAEMTILGAGGAGRAAAVQAALDGVKKLHIANRRTRSWKAAGELAEQISRMTDCEADLTDLDDRTALAQKIDASSLLVNATPVGMAAQSGKSPLPDPDLLREGLTVMDLIYDPARTRLLEDARRAGCRTFNGMYMLLWQGAEAFRLWTGQEMPVEKIRRSFFAGPEDQREDPV